MLRQMADIARRLRPLPPLPHTHPPGPRTPTDARPPSASPTACQRADTGNLGCAAAPNVSRVADGMGVEAARKCSQDVRGLELRRPNHLHGIRSTSVWNPPSAVELCHCYSALFLVVGLIVNCRVVDIRLNGRFFLKYFLTDSYQCRSIQTTTLCCCIMCHFIANKYVFLCLSIERAWNCYVLIIVMIHYYKAPLVSIHRRMERAANTPNERTILNVRIYTNRSSHSD